MRRYAIAAIVGVMLLVAGFGIAKAYYGWARVSTPCSRIVTMAQTDSGFAVVCEDEPGTIFVQKN